MNDKHFITEDYLYESYRKGYSFYEKEIYGKCDICVSHVPVLGLGWIIGNETTYFTKLKLDPNVIYFFGHTHRNEEITNYITQEDGTKASVKGYNIGVGYPPVYDRGVGIPHLRTFKWIEKENKLTEINCHIEQNKTDYYIIDFHAETTAEKSVFSLYVDGKVDAFFGTHTHVQTNDGRILPKGTYYLTDAGMCGPTNCAIGSNFQEVYEKMRYNSFVSFKVSKNKCQINGIVFTLTKNPKDKKFQIINIQEN